MSSFHIFYTNNVQLMSKNAIQTVQLTVVTQKRVTIRSNKILQQQCCHILLLTVLEYRMLFGTSTTKIYA